VQYVALKKLSFTQGNILLKELTQTINNEIKLYILGVSIDNKLGNWLISLSVSNFTQKY